MENHDNLVSSDQKDDKEYQIPELVDLNSIGAALGELICTSGSSADSKCITGFAL